MFEDLQRESLNFKLKGGAVTAIMMSTILRSVVSVSFGLLFHQERQNIRQRQ